MSTQIQSKGMDYEPVQDNGPANRASRREDRLIQLIENRDTIRRYEGLLRQMQKGSLDVPGFFKSVAVDAAIELADLMRHGETDKVRLEAVKDILDRAGHGKTQKVSINGQVNVDHDTSKMELVNLILSSARRAGIAGIRVKDDSAAFELPAKQVGPTIDVKPLDTVPVGLDEAPPEGS